MSRRQEQFQQGKTEMIEHFTRALVVLERQIYDSQKRVEQLRSINESFIQHLGILEAINPKAWENSDINKELNRALSAVEDARTEYTRSRAVISAETDEDVLAATTNPGYGGAIRCAAAGFPLLAEKRHGVHAAAASPGRCHHHHPLRAFREIDGLTTTSQEVEHDIG